MPLSRLDFALHHKSLYGLFSHLAYPFFSLSTLIHKKHNYFTLNIGYTLYSEYHLTIVDNCREVKC
jgi:hypothetical protein